MRIAARCILLKLTLLDCVSVELFCNLFRIIKFPSGAWESYKIQWVLDFEGQIWFEEILNSQVYRNISDPNSSNFYSYTFFENFENITIYQRVWKVRIIPRKVKFFANSTLLNNKDTFKGWVVLCRTFNFTITHIFAVLLVYDRKILMCLGDFFFKDISFLKPEYINSSIKVRFEEYGKFVTNSKQNSLNFASFRIFKSS